MKPRVTVKVDVKCDVAALVRAVAFLLFLLT
jgi:hypothetical protein